VAQRTEIRRKLHLFTESIPPPSSRCPVTVEPDVVRFLNAMSAGDTDVVDERHLLVTCDVEPDEVYQVGHHVV